MLQKVAFCKDVCSSLSGSLRSPVVRVLLVLVDSAGPLFAFRFLIRLTWVSRCSDVGGCNTSVLCFLWLGGRVSVHLSMGGVMLCILFSRFCFPTFCCSRLGEIMLVSYPLMGYVFCIVYALRYLLASFSVWWGSRFLFPRICVTGCYGNHSRLRGGSDVA